MPPLVDIARVDILNLSNKPSVHSLISNILQLNRLIKDLLEQNKSDGVVITHGTDTLEKIAYALYPLVQNDNTIIVTRAMRNVSQLGYDGSENRLILAQVYGAAVLIQQHQLMCVR